MIKAGGGRASRLSLSHWGIRVLKFRYNRASYFTFLAILVGGFILLISVMDEPPRLHGELILILLAVPRLHDIGESGWWVTVPIAIEIATVVLFVRSGMSLEGMKIATGLLAIFFLFAMVVLGLIPGQKRPNPWGDVPPAGINWGKPKRI